MWWHVRKVLHGNHLQWFMVALYYEAPSKQIRAEPLAGKHNDKKFPFDVGIPGLRIHEALAGKCNGLVLSVVLLYETGS